jgi:Pentapeptide repeats (8 copies)/Domain of unknown function (DUF3303)
MLFLCQFTWFPGTTRRAVAQRVVAQHDAGANHPDRIKGWYNLAGGGAGFLLVEYDDAKELTAFLQPYMDLMSFDVRAITQLDYDDRIAELRQIATATETDAMAGRMSRSEKATAKSTSRQLAKKDLSRANLSGLNLAGADMRRTKLRRATALDVDLTGADLSGADLSEANLARAHLRDARLVDTKLQGTDLRGADLTGAEVPDRSKLDQARLEGAQGVPDAGEEGEGESGSTGGR